MRKRLTDITFTLANFGEAPFGRQLIGVIEVADPIDGCTQIQNDLTPEDIFSPKILLVDRGDCAFVTKAHYAQIAGSVLLIIVDQKDNIPIRKILMIDDNSGVGNKVSPSFL